jgi:hypothetical protein
MVDMTMLCGTRIRYIRIPVYLIGDDLVGDIEEDGDSSMCVTNLVLEASNRFKGSKAMTSALRRRFLGARL